jgi:hypothetical protein
VTLAKRTAEYRTHRARLRSLLPIDVWLDEEHGATFVLFALTPAGPDLETLLGFAVDMVTHSVKASAPVSVQMTRDALIAKNMTPVSK